MPAKYSIKEYAPGAYYHIFNRGVEKRTIFEDDHDYKTFLALLQLYLTLDLPGSSRKTKIRPLSKPINNFAGNLTLLSYCLMPNHFHLMVRQNEIDGINHFMRSLCTQYSMYFNKKYHRVGHLFQGIYKAVKVEREEQWIYLTKYIHRNPLDLSPFRDHPGRVSEYKYSSYQNYLGNFQQNWVQTQDILNHFHHNHQKYQQFVEGQADITPIYRITLDYD